jgi:hypothetical protein
MDGKRKAKRWWEGGERGLGDYFKPGQEVTPIRYEGKLIVSEVLICWMGLRYRMSDGSIWLEHHLRPLTKREAGYGR